MAVVPGAAGINRHARSNSLRSRVAVDTGPAVPAVRTRPTGVPEPDAMVAPAKPKGEIHMTTENKNRPSHGVYIVEGEGDNAYWTKVGAAWPHKDGDGFNIQLTALPIDGRVSIRKLKPQQSSQQEGRAR